MSRAFKIKAVVLAAFAVASVVLMGVILSSMQDKLSVDDCTSDIRYEMESLPGLLAAADEETAQNTETFDAVYQSKAESWPSWRTTTWVSRPPTPRWPSTGICSAWAT